MAALLGPADAGLFSGMWKWPRPESRLPTVVLCALLQAACAGQPAVEWERTYEERLERDRPGTLAMRGDGSIGFVQQGTTGAQAGPSPIGCPASLRIARSGASGMEQHAVWWSPRPDSSARLIASRSMDGGRSWETPIPVDTVDRSDVGCRRPAPAIAADSATGAVHVAYSMHALEGTGVFFAHSMERGAIYHWPVVIVYGDALVEVAVSVLRDTVAVAYTDPNMRRPRIGLALSHTMGHIFEERLVVPGGGNLAASAPDVALAPGRIAVSWVERGSAGEATVFARTGALRAGAR